MQIEMQTAMISLEQLEEMFGNIASSTDWNVDGPLVWGYFFTDESEDHLIRIVPLLQAQGYRFVDLFASDPAEGVEEHFFLHVEKTETHSPLTLHERNQQLYAFAKLHRLRSYDGMDVGPINDPTTHIN